MYVSSYKKIAFDAEMAMRYARSQIPIAFLLDFWPCKSHMTISMYTRYVKLKSDHYISSYADFQSFALILIDLIFQWFVSFKMSVLSCIIDVFCIKQHDPASMIELF